MEQERIPQRVALIRLERLDNDFLLYHPGLTRSIHLNQTAALIWQLCDGRRSTRAIADALSDAYPADREEIVEQVDATLRRLAEEGAIEFA